MPLSKKRNRDRMRAIRAGFYETPGDGGFVGVCATCGETRVTETHHKDGNHKNNFFDNLITLCPTCHALITRKLTTLDNLMSATQTEPEVVQPEAQKQEKLEVLQKLIEKMEAGEVKPQAPVIATPFFIKEPELDGDGHPVPYDW